MLSDPSRSCRIIKSLHQSLVTTLINLVYAQSFNFSLQHVSVHTDALRNESCS
jgi:hypothetical protein